MSWTSELLEIYEYNCNSGRKFSDGEPEMLPIAHSTANAQIEVTISGDGEFKGASAVDKSVSKTVIPATENSATRSGSGAIPMPFDDKLVYIAGDYGKYVVGKRSDNENFFLSYMNQLRRWYESPYANKAVKALYSYLDKRTLMSDLVRAGVLKIDEETGKLASGVKIATIAQEDSFVRFIIENDPPLKTWDNELCKKYGLDMVGDFQKFNATLVGEKQLCYATGKMLPATYKHPSKIRNAGDKAKLFSTNDESGFSYRGRFNGKEEAVSISYEFSQKIHNALRWLIQKQGDVFDTMTLIVWASALQDTPKPTAKGFDDDEEFADEKEIPTTAPMYMALLKKNIYGYRTKLAPNTKVMIMGIDAATQGRMNMSLYTELMGSDYLNNIEKWHSQTTWTRYSRKLKKTVVNSFSLIEIIKCAFGMEQGNFIDCDKKIKGDNVLRLLPCVTAGKKIPNDVIHALYNKASNPLAYENGYNHRTVLETACGMIRKSIIDNEKINREDEYLMAYDPNNTDRSYLYGCLLAVADKAENEAYTAEERNVRQTNAKRYWNVFSQRPYQTWGNIAKNLTVYFNKLGKGQVKYRKRINEILDKMDEKIFKDNSRLENVYLLGYSHYMTKMYDEDMKKNKEEN